jgi:DNA-directed RNA polymerase specialized sigma24 family protein
VLGGQTDVELVRAAEADEAAFVEFVERHQRRLARYATRRLGPAQARTSSTRALAIAYAKRVGFRPSSDSAEAWLLGITTNLIRAGVDHHPRSSSAE